MQVLLILSFLFFIRVASSTPIFSSPLAILNPVNVAQVAAFFKSIGNSEVPANATENDLSGPCKAMTLIFAKGTNENGNVGDGASPGPPLIAELRKKLGGDKVAAQGIEYDANVAGSVNINS